MNSIYFHEVDTVIIPISHMMNLKSKEIEYHFQDHRAPKLSNLNMTLRLIFLISELLCPCDGENIRMSQQILSPQIQTFGAL